MKPKFAAALGIRLTLLLLLSLGIFSCGGGGGGGSSTGGGSTGGGDTGGAGTNNPPSPPASEVVSGMVQAPGGHLAFKSQPGIVESVGNILLPSACAALSGTSSVSDGTTVELIRVNNAGASIAVLATTAVSNGRYSFDLTSLGLSFSSDLIVQVRNPVSGARMRAFAVSDNVNIDPVSEAVVRVVLEKIAGSPQSGLGNFTSKEISDLIAAADILTSVQRASAGLDLENAVSQVKAIVTAHPGLAAFMISAAAAGEAEGAGDVGEYFPAEVGNVWKYQVTQTGSSPYTDTIQITGTKNIGGVETLVFLESNSLNSGNPQEYYYVKTAGSLIFYGSADSSDKITPQIVPYDTLRFPLRLGSTFQQIHKTGLNFGQDVDGDGAPDLFSVDTAVAVKGIESVTVPAGTFANCIRVEVTLTMTVTLSSNGRSTSQSSLDTTWYAPSVGEVKEVVSIPSGSSTVTLTYALTSYSRGLGSDAVGFDVIDAEYSKVLDRLVIVSGSPANQLHIYDPQTRQDTTVILPLAGSCVSVSPDGLFAAVGHNAYISYVNLSTATLLKTIPVSADISDVVLAGNGYAYAFPRRDQWVSIHSVEIATNKETLSNGATIRERTVARLHPNGTAIYGADNGLYPSDIEKYDISGGPAAFLYDSPYHGDYLMNGNLWISEDGLKIFTKGGNAFRSSAVQADDMRYIGALEGLVGTNFSGPVSLTHSASAGKVAAIPNTPYSVTNPLDTEIRIFDYTYLTFQRSIALPGHGVHVFYDKTGTKIYSIVKNDSGKYGVIKY